MLIMSKVRDFVLIRNNDIYINQSTEINVTFYKLWMTL